MLLCGCGLVLDADRAVDQSADAGRDSRIPPMDGQVDARRPDASIDATSPDALPPVDGMVVPDATCPDSDGDGLCDVDDRCPDDAGDVDVDGCPCLALELCSGVDDDCDGTTDEDWTVVTHDYGGHRYLLCHDPGLPRDLAQEACNRWGGHLVILDSMAENQTIADTARSHAEYAGRWIDLYDAAMSTTTDGRDWVWSTTGARATFFAWGDTPNNLGGTEHCVEMVPYIASLGTRGTWNDLTCTDERAYICERP